MAAVQDSEGCGWVQGDVEEVRGAVCAPHAAPMRRFKRAAWLRQPGYGAPSGSRVWCALRAIAIRVCTYGPQSLYASEGKLAPATLPSPWRFQPLRLLSYHAMQTAPIRMPATAHPMPIPAAAPELTPEEPPELEEVVVVVGLAEASMEADRVSIWVMPSYA